MGKQGEVAKSQHHRRPSVLGRRLLVACMGTLLVAVSAGGAAARRPLRAGRPRHAATVPANRAQPLRASITIGRGVRPIPDSYLGVSIEYPDVSLYARGGPAVDRAIAMMATADSQPLVLRVGGASADRAWWVSPGEPSLPPGVAALGPSWLSMLRAMVGRDRLRVLLDLNLAVHSPALAVTFASTAAGALGSALAGVEVGNEPDHYGRQPWLARQLVAASEEGVSAHWMHAYTPQEYENDYRDYAFALRTGIRRLAIGAPDLASPAIRWLAPLARLGPLGPNFVSAHRYASSSCWPRTSPRYPTVALLLSESVTAGLARSLGRMLAFAHAHRIALRVTELGTISCGGNPGVADAFATALWAPDVLFELLRAGVISVNWHLRPDAPNGPFVLSRNGIAPRPVLSGLAAFAQVLAGPHGVLAGCTVLAPGLHIKAWAVRHPGRTTLLVINKGSRPAAVAVSAGRARVARAAWLSAPSASARRGVTYAGRWIGSDGRWHGRLRIARLPVQGGIVRLRVGGVSAAVVTLS